MRVTSAVLVAGAAITVSAQNSKDGYLAEVCMPLNSSKLPDLNAPCNAFQAIQFECTYGQATGLSLLYSQFNNTENGSYGYGDGDDDDDDSPPELDLNTQRVCACESQFFDLLSGCTACYKAHGDDELEAYLGDVTFLSSISSQYCAATATPSVDLVTFLYQVSDPSAIPTSILSAQASQTTSSFSDHIGNRTDVSYYFTPAVTGTAAWSISAPTASGASFTSVHTSGGQIVPTLAADAASSTGKSASSTSSPNGGARETAAAMGVIGLLGVVALL